MNGKDKISVIIPCYNVQKYIMRCFDSIYSQTYGFENLEVILIDDLSTDNTWSILESLQRKYPENVISLKIQKKGKCGGARNLGMDICTGKYITFVDADDYVHPDMLRVLYDRMTEDDYDVAQCGVSCFKADKPNVLEVNDFEIQRLDLDNVDNRKNLIIGLTGFTNVTAWAKLYSTKFIIEHNLRFIEDVYYEDTHFSMLCVLLAKKYCKVQSTLYYYFENTEGIIRSEISNAKIRDAKIIMDHIRQANTAFRILCSEEQQVNWYKENSNYKCDRVYSYFENNELKFGKKEALTITESDQLEYIEQLINDFPEITFHIAASTIMSDKLTRLDINNNVELYPCITEQKRKELFERCDIYLDINHYRELYNAVNEAMVNNMIILAFDNTAHSKELYPMGNIFESSNYVKMKETLKNIITSQTIFNEYIDRQKKQLKQLAAKVVMGDTDESI